MNRSKGIDRAANSGRSAVEGMRVNYRRFDIVKANTPTFHGKRLSFDDNVVNLPFAAIRDRLAAPIHHAEIRA